LRPILEILYFKVKLKKMFDEEEVDEDEGMTLKRTLRINKSLKDLKNLEWC
jgi:hypothetical protein